MRLPSEWDSHLKSLEEMLVGVERSERVEEEWSAIRERYLIEHPHQRSRFKYYSDAARVLANYWQGEDLPEEDLVSQIITDSRMSVRAFEYATHLTFPESPERKYVEKANRFLWKDASR